MGFRVCVCVWGGHVQDVEMNDLGLFGVNFFPRRVGCMLPQSVVGTHLFLIMAVGGAPQNSGW